MTEIHHRRVQFLRKFTTAGYEFEQSAPRNFAKSEIWHLNSPETATFDTFSAVTRTWLHWIFPFDEMGGNRKQPVRNSKLLTVEVSPATFGVR